MANTTEIAGSSAWQIAVTAAAQTTVIATPRDSEGRWARRGDTTLPAEEFKGHFLKTNEDREFLLAAGETLFIYGPTGYNTYLTTSV